MNDSPDFVSSGIETPSGVEGLASKSRFLALLIRVQFWLALVSALFGGIQWYFAYLFDIGRTPDISYELAVVLDSVYMNIGYVQLGLIILSMPIFLVWFGQAYTNLKELRANDRQYSTGWAIGGWFIPFANFFIPYNVAKEIWKASSPQAYDPDNSHAWKKVTDHSPVREWWIMFVVYGLVSRFFFTGSGDGSSLTAGIAAHFFANLLFAALCPFTIKVVKGIQERQQQRLALIGNPEPDEPASAEPLPVPA